MLNLCNRSREHLGCILIMANKRHFYCLLYFIQDHDFMLLSTCGDHALSSTIIIKEALSF